MLLFYRKLNYIFQTYFFIKEAIFLNRVLVSLSPGKTIFIESEQMNSFSHCLIQSNNHKNKMLSVFEKKKVNHNSVFQCMILQVQTIVLLIPCS